MYVFSRFYDFFIRGIDSKESYFIVVSVCFGKCGGQFDKFVAFLFFWMQNMISMINIDLFQ